MGILEGDSRELKSYLLASSSCVVVKIIYWNSITMTAAPIMYGIIFQKSDRRKVQELGSKNDKIFLSP